MKALFVVGRVIFGGFFLYSGVNHLKNPKAMTGYTASKNVPAPEQAVLATGALLAAAGASIVLGYKPRLGTAGVVAFLGAVSPIMHDFWNAKDPQQGQNDMIHFSKNMALLGAALALGAVEDWPASISK